MGVMQRYKDVVQRQRQADLLLLERQNFSGKLTV